MSAGLLFFYLSNICFVICSIGSSLALELPRGIPLSKAPLYQVGQPFRCLNGLGEIPWLTVNDDYCDCPDGSDEPGTAACSNGMFQCRDTLYKAVPVPSSMVNDGVCDCCDGSDEYDGLMQCPLTCGALAAAGREARSIKRAEIEEGHRKYNEYIKKLPTIIEEKRLEAEKREAERAAQEAERQQREEEERLAREKEEAEKQRQEEERAASDSVESDEAPKLSEDKIEPDHEENTGSKVNDATHDESIEDKNLDDMPDEEEPTHKVPEDHEPEPVKPQIDYGPNEGFRMLQYLEACLEFTDLEYTYQLCPFKEVQQLRAGSPSHGTVLGRWSRWEAVADHPDEAARYAVMVYDSGDGCWNGPSRSTKVHVHCGSENRLTSAAEPSRCEYVMHISTPAACHEDPDVLLARLHPED